MKRKDWRNLAGTVMWFFAGMALWGYALTLMERREAGKRGALPS